MNVVAHGGEPLLVGAERLEQFFSAVESAAKPTRIRWSIQTNAVLVTKEICDVLARHCVIVGVSLDGGEKQNARRLDHRGRPTWRSALDGINMLRNHSGCRWEGILTVVDLDQSPEETLEAILELAPPQLDLLQPFTTHDSAGVERPALAHQFGDWMTRALKRWIEEPSWAATRIRVFEDALQASLTRKPKTDWFGPRRVSYLVVEADGSYDLLDQLKVIGADSLNYRSLGGSILNLGVHEAESAALKLLEAAGASATPSACHGCRWGDVCAGGHLTARHSFLRGFDNPSVYCEGLQQLLDEASAIMHARTSPSESSACSEAV